MKNLQDFEDLHIYFIGIGGISMSGLAKLSQKFGAVVVGSDTGENNSQLEVLDKMGIVVFHSHNADNIANSIDLVVYTSAISTNNPEYLRAVELGIRTMERAEFLGILAGMYKQVIAISGTHGKTTTTAILGEILVEAGLNPTIHLGGESNNLKANTVIGDSEYLVVEACEYKESFRYLTPDISVITNIELDHLDYYKDYNSIHRAFSNFAQSSREIFVPSDCKIEHKHKTTIYDDWQVKELEFVYGGYNYNVLHKGVFYGTFRLNMLGEHNVRNSLFAIAVADKLGVKKEVIARAISNFQGVGRRYETIHTFNNGCRVIIDYAHHYTEIENSIKGISDIYKNILIVFQPHTYSRTLKLFDEFVDTLSKFDKVILFQTYPAREELLVGGTAKDLYNAISSKDKIYFSRVDELFEFIKSNNVSYDCVLILGAGDLAEKLKVKFLNL